MVTLANLRSQTSKDLIQLAKSNGVAGYSSMKKEQLVQAILKIARKRDRQMKNGKASIDSTNGKKRPTSKQSDTVNRVSSHSRRTKSNNNGQQKSLDVERSAIANKLERESLRRENMKNLALTAAIQKDSRAAEKDRIVLIVRDSYWLQAYWEITAETVSRAKSSLEKHWRSAKPVLRVYEVVEENDTFVENMIREIPVHSGTDNWYVDVSNPPNTYRVAIGYITENEKFFCLAKSNRVATPSPNAKGHSTHWADIASDCENIFAMSGGYNPNEETSELRQVFEEKLRRPMLTMGPNHAALLDNNLEFPFEVDAQMVIYGAAIPGSSVTIAGEPLQVDPNGNFSVRMELPDNRQVLPVVASSRDGSQQRTTVLAIERNTKVMEAINIENDDM
ncbi:MAG: DUF4912 domain-containing protein [Pirellulaceae bacterium]